MISNYIKWKMRISKHNDGSIYPNKPRYELYWGSIIKNMQISVKLCVWRPTLGVEKNIFHLMLSRNASFVNTITKIIAILVKMIRNICGYFFIERWIGILKQQNAIFNFLGPGIHTAEGYIKCLRKTRFKLWKIDNVNR